MPATILVVDDDLTTRKMLRFVLEQQGGHQIHEADGAEDALQRLLSLPLDLVLMDVVMPGVDGFELCKRIRATSSVPVIIISGRGDLASRVHGLQLGADDYLPKPFDPSELGARVEAVLRRSLRAPRTDADGRMRVGDLTLDLGEHRVELRNGRGEVRQVQLTPTEFKLLLVLARQPGQVVARQALQAALWGPAAVDPGAGYNTLNSYVSELRNRIEPNPRQPRYLVTVRNLGYKLEP